MLWVDDDFVTLDDLKAINPEVVDVTDVESIVIDGDGGLIRRAKSMAQQTLSRHMSFANFSPTDLSFRDVNFPITTAEFRYNFAGFAQLVISGESESNWSAIKNWVVNKTLIEFYRMASNKNKDRYSDFYDDAVERGNLEFWPNVKRRGLSIIFNPLVAPGAIMERCGLFNANNVTLVNGAGTSTSELDFAVTWVGSKYVSPTVKLNSESYRSARVTSTMVNGKVARVSIAGLTPPNGQQPDFNKSSCRYSPGVAVGWNVWVGDPADPLKIMYRQNVAGPIPIGTTFWDLPGNAILSGEQLDLGQYEDIVLEIRTRILLA